MGPEQTLSNETHPLALVEPLRTLTETALGLDAPTPHEFSITIGRAMGTVVVTIQGEVDTSNARHLGEILSDLIENQENLRVVVDLHDVGHLDPAGVAALLVATNHAHQRGGALTVKEPGGAVYESLESAGVEGSGMAEVVPISGHRRSRRPTVHGPVPPAHPQAMAHHPSAEPGPSAQAQRASGDPQ